MRNDFCPEILSPAGDMERLQTAIRYGADAVYLGATQFGMRASPQNFTPDMLYEAVQLAHAHGVRLYLTVNTLPRCDETPHLPDFLREVGKTGMDALIIADIGVLQLARDILPDMEIHASTQVGICNELTANALGSLGVRRVVLARELTIGEIRTIRERISPDIELEAFVHGAMCMSVSGRCTISNYLTNRDANRGACTQPCRWNYCLVEEKRPGIYMPIVENGESTSILSAKDLCMIEHLEELYDAGVTSFKIEGRGKTAYYVAVVTNAYRAAVDAIRAGNAVPDWAVRELETISHRDYSTGFYYGRGDEQQTYRVGSYVQQWEVAAVVLGVSDGRLILSERNRFSVGDTLELLEPGAPARQVYVTDMRNAEGENIDCINHPKAQISLPFEGDAVPGAFLRRKK